MNRKVEYRETSGCFYGFWIMVGAVALTLVLCLLFPSCKTPGSLSEKVNIRDSVAIRWHDSIRWHIRDSVNIIEHHVTVRDSSGLFIQLAQGGGTYNAKTGEATNVAGVQQSDTHHEQRDSTNHYRALATEYMQKADSLSNCLSDYKSERAELRQKSRTGYDRFCSRWFWITAIWLLLKVAAWIMEKFPATAPYIILIRRFVPFL